MKKTIVFISSFLLISCKANDKIKFLERENIKLEIKIDSLQKDFIQSLSAIIINNNYKSNFKKGDSINFVVALACNKSEIIDSINLDLFDNKNELISANDYEINSNIENGFSYFKIKKLKQGEYIYKGNIMFQNKKLPIEYEFKIE